MLYAYTRANTHTHTWHAFANARLLMMVPFLCIHTYLSILVSIYLSICIQTYICMHMHMQAHMHVCAHVYTHIRVQLHIHPLGYLNARAHKHVTYILFCVLMPVVDLSHTHKHARARTHTHTHTHTQWRAPGRWRRSDQRRGSTRGARELYCRR